MSTENQLVDASRLLEILFEEQSRPSLRWLRERQASRAIPFVRLGRLIFFDPEQVRAALASRCTIKSRGAL